MTAAPTTKPLPRRGPHAAATLSRLPLILVILVPALALWPVVPAEFIPVDDPANVSRNPDFNPPTLAKLGHYWTEPFLNMYAPLTYTAWAGVARLAWMESIDHGGLQLNPYVFHAVNLLVHVINAVLVYAILRRLAPQEPLPTPEPPTLPPWAACAGALLFALHPMQVEPVAWVTGFRDLLATMFALASVLAYVEHLHREGPGRTRAYVLACALLLAALLCKPTTVIVPLVVAAIDWGVFERPLWKVAKPVAGLLLIAAPFAIVARSVQSAALTYTPPLWARPIVALDAIAFYLMKLVFPLHLGMDYGRSPQWLLDQRAVMWVWALGVLLVIVVWMLRHDRRVIAGILAFVAALLPVLGLTKFDFQHHSTVADRYVYLAMLGPALLLALAVRKRGSATAVVCAAVLLLLAVRSHAQSRAWKDGESIFRSTLATNPHSLLANRGLAQIAQTQGRLEEAEALYEAALRDHPGDAVTSFHLGVLYLATGRASEAVPHLRTAAAVHDQPWVVSNYANALAQVGEVAEAQKVLEAALAKTPDSAELHATLAAVRFRQGDRAGAIEQYRAALRINPNLAVAAQELAALERAVTTSNAPSTQPGE